MFVFRESVGVCLVDLSVRDECLVRFGSSQDRNRQIDFRVKLPEKSI
jgi:hypothetical protein